MSEGRPVLPRRAKEPADHNHNLRPQTTPTPRFARLIAAKEERSRSRRVVLTKKRREKIAEFKGHFPEGIGTSGWIHNLVIFMDDPEVRYKRIQHWLKENIEPAITRHYNNNRSQNDEMPMPLLVPESVLTATASLESNNRNLRPFRTSTPIQGQSTDNLPAAGDQQNRSSHPNSQLLSPDITANTADPLRNLEVPYNPNPNDTVPLRIEIVYENNEDQNQEAPHVVTPESFLAVQNEVRERHERMGQGQMGQHQEPDQMNSRVQHQNNQANYRVPQENQANQQIPQENMFFRPQPRPPSRCTCPQCRPTRGNPYYSHVNSYYDSSAFQRQYPIPIPNPYQYQNPFPSFTMADSSSNGLLNQNPFPTSSDSNHSNQIPSMNQPQPEQNNGQGTGSNSNRSQSSSRRGTTTSPVEGPVTHFTKSIKFLNIISRHFEKEVKTRAFLIPMGNMYTKLTRVYKDDIVPSHSKTLRAFSTRPKTERFEQAQERFQADEREREELDRIPDQYNQDGEPLSTTHHDEAEEESDSDINITQCSDL